MLMILSTYQYMILILYVAGAINTIVSAIVCPIIAKHKGRSTVGWSLCGLLLGVIAIIIVACLPEKYY